ncbi:DNA internalization-related competence protein ComEC/Rec2 [Candidatus Thiodictyon syntrophicum]|jgi:competence protein ComEC|uniref:DNA internalization-related competence protein ComEC/Rec2 n=1 Tax=Candidatus Thiodictyon syntrophicum TaxID=1166950 RepID=A0A2K8U831_9GAMM|nr:DNA internalization-related competence protein ComEC/Rec2 [Candidatus Thiodictyon syntrophicum]AUB81705.1 DNA internalization-related competence protein ComEC/Rec2 [Candidatus Thiodictyon syntrophicum]
MEQAKTLSEGPSSRVPAGSGSGLAPLGLAFALGVACFYLLPQLPPTWTTGVYAVLAAILTMFRRPGLCRPVAALLVGVLYAQVHTAVQLANPFPERLARAPLTLVGRIASLPADLGQARRFLFEVEQADTADGAPLPFTGLVRLSWYEEAQRLRAGERWRLPVRLKPRHGLSNPGGFDYERWLFEQGIKATGTVRRGAGAQRLDPGPGPYRLMRLRQNFNEHLAAVLGPVRSLPLVQALVTGDQSGFERTDWEAMTRTGTSHLVAISGLNLGLIAAVAFFLIRALWSRCPSCALTLAAPRAAALGAFGAAFAYAALAGFSVSTQRALIMAAVLFAVLVWERTPRHWHALILALTGVLLWDPRAALSFGFWLSFAAVAVLLFNLGQRLPRRDLWSRLGRAQWAVAVGLLPLLLLLFGRVSAISPLVNLVAEPLFTLILFPLVLGSALLSLVPGLTLPLVLTAQLLNWCLAALAWIAAFPWAVVALPLGPPWVWPFAFLGVGLLLAPRGLPGRWLGLPLLLPLVLVRPPAPAPGELWFTLLDVGQGLSAVLRTRDGTLVFDTGPAFDSGFTAGAAVVAPFLTAAGVTRVDVLMVSHADRDHAGGAAALLERLPVGLVRSGEPAALGVAGVEACRAGDGWTWSGVRFAILYPAVPPDGSAAPRGNDASCVLRVETGGRSVLLTGDLGQRPESDLVQRLGPGLASDVLVAGHHGSPTSTGAAFLDAVAPRWVLYASGYANHFGFPSREVRERVAARGIPALDTGVSGAIEVRLGADGSLTGPRAWRERARRVWTQVGAAGADQAAPERDAGLPISR